MMSHVTWDLEVNLPIVPASQSTNSWEVCSKAPPGLLPSLWAQATGLSWSWIPFSPEKQPVLLWGWNPVCLHCCPAGAVNVHRSLTPAEPALSSCRDKGSGVPDLGAGEGAEHLSCLLSHRGVNFGYHLGACHWIVVWVLLTHPP